MATDEYDEHAHPPSASGTGGGATPDPAVLARQVNLPVPAVDKLLTHLRQCGLLHSPPSSRLPNHPRGGRDEDDRTVITWGRMLGTIEQQRERTRTRLAYCVVGLVGLVLVVTMASIWRLLPDQSAAKLIDLSGTLLILVGPAIGFYFGSRTTER
jgi:hypothetical protein